MTLMVGDCRLEYKSVKSDHVERKRVISRFKQDILRFEIAMDEPRILQHSEGIQQLRHKYFDQLSTKTLELVLFDELIKIGR